MIQAVPGGIVLAVRTIPRAGRSGPSGTRGDALLVRLQAPPVDGAANAELVRVIAALFGVPSRAVTIVSGERSREKRVKVAGVDIDVATSCLKDLASR